MIGCFHAMHVLHAPVHLHLHLHLLLFTSGRPPIFNLAPQPVAAAYKFEQCKPSCTKLSFAVAYFVNSLIVLNRVSGSVCLLNLTQRWTPLCVSQLRTSHRQSCHALWTRVQPPGRLTRSLLQPTSSSRTTISRRAFSPSPSKRPMRPRSFHSESSALSEATETSASSTFMSAQSIRAIQTAPALFRPWEGSTTRPTHRLASACHRSRARVRLVILVGSSAH